jgi:pentapeptide MXKDX repeat protein
VPPVVKVLTQACNFRTAGTSHISLQVKPAGLSTQKPYLKEKMMKKIFGSFALACILTASMAAFAQSSGDSMKQDSTSQDSMKKDDSMKNDSIKKDDTKKTKKTKKKDAMKKDDSMKKDDMKKDDSMKNDPMKQN